MKLRMCICPSQPATSMHAKHHGKGFFFCSRLEGITGLAYSSDFGRPILAALVFARGGSGVSSLTLDQFGNVGAPVRILYAPNLLCLSISTLIY